jgi:hypothetical protein
MASCNAGGSYPAPPDWLAPVVPPLLKENQSMRAHDAVLAGALDEANSRLAKGRAWATALHGAGHQ